jgi:hypothetical protein
LPLEKLLLVGGLDGIIGAGAGSGGGVGDGAGIRLAGIIDFTRVVAIAARDITSDLALLTRRTTFVRADAALRLIRFAALRALVRTFLSDDLARLAARRTLRRALEPAERALDFSLLRDFLRFLAMKWVPPWTLVKQSKF